MGAAIDLSGSRFGRLRVAGRVGTMQGQVAWQCFCDCGSAATAVPGYRLRTGATSSCGCLHREVSSRTFKKLRLTHGMAGTREYKSWQQMRDRCTNPNHHAWMAYGGRGVEVCERWAAFEAFFEDMGVRPDGKTLDRIDPEGGYSPGNCRWATVLEQNRNRRKKVC